MLNISSADQQSLSEDDREQFRKVQMRLYSVVSYRGRFAAALKLSNKLYDDNAENLRQVAACQSLRTTDPSAYRRTFTALMDEVSTIPHMIAVVYRDAIMTVYHLHKLLVDGIQSEIRKVTFLAARLDTKKLKESRKPFLLKFPNAELLRDAVAHSAEQLMNGDASNLENMTGREFSTTAKGKTFTFILNQESLDAIDQSIADLRIALNLYPGVKFYDKLATDPLWK